MITLFPVNIAIIIIAFDLETGDRYIVSTEQNTLAVPTASLSSDSQPVGIAVKLCEEYIDLDAAWINPREVTVNNEDGNLVVTLGAIIPFDTTLKNGAKFVAVSQSNLTNNILKALQHELVQ